MTQVVIALLIAVALSFAFLSWRYWQQARAIQQRYAGVTSIQYEVSAIQVKLEQAKQNQKQFEVDNQQRRTKLIQESDQEKTKYTELQKKVALLEENLEDISFGLYKPHFSFLTSAEYKAALENLREKEKGFLRGGNAVICGVKWSVGNSEKEGQRMSKQYSKVMLRAFNGECDATVANVSWNNIAKMEERVRKSSDAINQLGSVMHFSLTPEYIQLKLDELKLTHEYEEKRNQEREEQGRIREQIREEDKAQREIDKARQDAEHEEVEYEKALTKAREEAQRATGSQLEKLTAQVKSLEAKVDEARQNKQRAIARAQLTKSGFVYVISNIGAFGEGVFKIGMTRRMEPKDRIDELSAASVPFPFDLHVMLYSDNAPDLEASLHKVLQDRQVNLINHRKEFFKDVNLMEIEEFVKKRGISAQFTPYAEAKQYRETLALREQRAAAATAG
jgi:uncharacterized protein YlxW (UPF0749 family)